MQTVTVNWSGYDNVFGGVLNHSWDIFITPPFPMGSGIIVEEAEETR